MVSDREEWAGMPDEFSLEAAAVEVIAEWLGVPRSWQPFDIPHRGVTVEERRAYVGRVWQRLREDGLTDGTRVDGDVEAALRVWTAPDLLVVVRAEQDFDPPQVLYRAVAGRELGVFSEQVAESIRFALVPAERVIDHVTGMLPPHRALPVEPCSVLVESGRRVTDTEEGAGMPTVAEQARRYERRDKEGVRAFSQWPVVLCGGFELYLRDRGNLGHVGTMQFFDTDRGRYVVGVQQAGDGKTRLNFIPSDGSHVARWLHEEVSFARRATG
ncbi:ESX secretion-associated protein EspG [Haloechinothrix alba]|nr:ESX secretion-associated protein EspG [Haloechinothrix alba]